MNRRQPRGFPADDGLDEFDEESLDRAAAALIEDSAWLPQTFDAQAGGCDPLELRDQVAEHDENSLLDRELTGDYAQDTVE